MSDPFTPTQSRVSLQTEKERDDDGCLFRVLCCRNHSEAIFNPMSELHSALDLVNMRCGSSAFAAVNAKKARQPFGRVRRTFPRCAVA